ncbi:MAG: [FeFe] hydrogenase, group A [Candidatus Riflebacteria bacterium]|nr:[FeFe] hydrogenase, group A [Candidatus Riflebacteria bacterium]
MSSSERNFLSINGSEIAINGERNLLELIRKAGIEIPTFCYHSELSIYGACRLCLVDIEGRGLQASCSIKPEPGMKIKTATEEIREIRKISVELLLANHKVECPTCPKSSSCKLEELGRKLGVTEVRFKKTNIDYPKDYSSDSLIRDPNKCVLCGDCVRYCREIQGIGAIDFAHRGKNTIVSPAFGKDLGKVECVNCGQCAAVCPVGAITVKPEVDQVFKALDNSEKVVVAQIAPAVRVALGEQFGMNSGDIVTGKITAALKRMGFAKVFDTSFSADLTVIEEGTEFLNRYTKGEKLPQFTSCCPGWVKFAEQYYPEILPRLSSCKSPQQMFGSLAREILPAMLGVKPENLVIVSIMPCTAKKFEARRPEFTHDKIRDIDHVLTTQELSRMIEASGLRFDELEPESLDLPLGFKTGAGVIFGASGGVTEAVLRFAVEKVTGKKLENVDFHAVRGEAGLREATFNLDGKEVRVAMVHGLKNARRVAEEVKVGKCRYDIIEVMACPGGCVGGAGQPVNFAPEVVKRRAKGLYEADKMLQLHKAQENPYIIETYEKILGEVGGQKAHHLLHTKYQSRRRITEKGMPLITGEGTDKLSIKICVGTNCYLKGSQNILKALTKDIEDQGLTETVDIQATFCFEKCGEAPNVMVGDQLISKCTIEKARVALNAELQKKAAETSATSS